MKQRHFTRFLALLIAVLVIVAVFPARAEAMTGTLIEWYGGSDPSCTHPSEKVSSLGYSPRGNNKHLHHLKCESCSAYMDLEESCSDGDSDGKCDNV